MSFYELAKRSGVPYSTLSDIVNGRTDIKDSSARVLHGLSEALDMSMDSLYGCGDETELYIYNKGRKITVEYGSIIMSYLGPKNLIALKELRYLSPEMTAHIDTYYSDGGIIFLEEEFYDLKDLFEENGYEVPALAARNLHIGKPSAGTKESIIDRALLVSDYMAVLPSDAVDQPDTVLVVNLSRPSARAHIRLSDYEVLMSNMMTGMEKRAKDAVIRNISIIKPAMEERRKAYAKIHI